MYSSVSFESMTAPPSISLTSFTKRFIARTVSSGSSIFSYLALASVRRPRREEDFRTQMPSKFADSSTTLDVSPTISESSPPIIPAIATGSSRLYMSRVLVSAFLSAPSRVTKSISSLGVSTFMLSTLEASNAWVG